MNFRSTNQTEVIIYEILEVYNILFASKALDFQAARLLHGSANLRFVLICHIIHHRGTGVLAFSFEYAEDINPCQIYAILSIPHYYNPFSWHKPY